MTGKRYSGKTSGSSLVRAGAGVDVGVGAGVGAAAGAGAKLAEPSERMEGKQVETVPLDRHGGAAQKQKRKASQLESTDPAFRTDDVAQ